MTSALAPIQSLAEFIDSLKPENGGYLINSFDKWLSSCDAPNGPTQVEYRHLLARIDIDTPAIRLSGRTCEHRLSILVSTMNFDGTRNAVGSLTPLTAYDVALLVARHLLAELATNTPYTPGPADIAPASKTPFLLISIPVILITSF